MFRNVFEKEAGQGLVQVALLGAAIASVLPAIVHFIRTLLGA
jgi:hypothetical protein